jgi:predicted metal-dependent HD superfamily phosphohydrolase
MASSGNLAEQASSRVEALLNRAPPPWMVYHSIDHTIETVFACKILAAGSRLQAEEQDALIVAAWFHDSGYAGGAEGHEERSVEIAGGFLRERGVDGAVVERVLSAIRATRMPQEPRSLLEAILCDADVIHVGREDFFLKSDLLRSEMEQRLAKTYSNDEWYRFNLDFVERHPFHTDFARKLYGEQRLRNLRILREKLAAVA